MAIDKLTPRYLNFEDDERLVKRIEMTDAVNIRIDSDDDGDAGVIKNVVGNTQVSLLGDTLPAGNNKVIGSVHNNVKGEIMFFVHNSGNNHRIYKYDDNLEKVITVYKNEATGAVASASADTLGFKATDYVDAAVLVDKDGDTLLYFTNGRGEPKKINVDKAIRGDYPDGYEGVEAYISLIKKPPLEPPTLTYRNDPEIIQNKIYGSQFQFACQYIYDDGEVSAISPVSECTKTLAHTAIDNNERSRFQQLNVVSVTSSRINSDIKKIRFLMREGNNGVFQIIEDVTTSNGGGSVSVDFKNDKAYIPISNNENNKQFDAVPLDVKALSISGNRLFLGNYKEGFEKVSVDVDLLPNYNEEVGSFTKSENKSPAMFAINASGQVSGSNWGEVELYAGNGITIDLSGLKDISYDGVFYQIDVGAKFNVFHCMGNWNDPPYSNGVQPYTSLSSVQSGADLLYTDSLYGQSDFQNAGMMSSPSDIRISELIELSGVYTKSSLISEIKNRINGTIRTISLTPLTDAQYNVFSFNTSGASYAPDLIGRRHFGELDVKIKARENNGTIYISFEPISITYRADDVAKELYNYDGSSKTVSLQSPSVFKHTEGLNTVGSETQIDYNERFLKTSLNTGGFVNGSASGKNPCSAEIFISFNNSEKMSFKSGASHQFGIVYSDKNGRLSTVYPAGESYVDWYDGRPSSGDGNVSMTMRVNHIPPKDAVKWYPVYAGNNTVGKFIQYTTSQGFYANEASSNTDEKVSVSEGADEALRTKRIYVSMRGLEGKDDSYREAYSAKLGYSYNEGDIVKIISVDGVKGYSDEFRVLGYNYYNFASSEVDDDRFKNPIATDATAASAKVEKFERSGYFLVLEDNGNSEFSGVAATDDATNGTQKETSWINNCLIEIRTPKTKVDNPVYYQIGKAFDCNATSHTGERASTTLTSSNLYLNGSNSATIKTAEKVYVGDRFTCTVASVLSGSGFSIGNTIDVEVVNVIPKVSGSFNYESTLRVTNTNPSVTTIPEQILGVNGTLDSSQANNAIVEITTGDVYYRRRRTITGKRDADKNLQVKGISFIEDYRISDFVDEAVNDFGKPNAYSEEADVVVRNSSITYSDAHVMDSDRLSLSSFNNSLANFLDIKNKYGAIQRMVDIEDAFYAVQEHKVTLFPVNRNVLQSAAGDATVTLSTDVVNLNSSKSFAGDYGCGNDPEAVVYYEGVLYFVDRKANKVFSISSSGIREISDIFADSYIADKLEKADKGGEYNIYSGIDPNNDEYLLSTRTIVNKTIDVDQGNLYVLPANSGVGQADFTPHSVNSTTFGNFNLLNFNFEDVDVNFEDMGNGVLYVDDGFSDNAMQLDTPVDNLTSGTSNIVYTDKDNTFLGVAQVDNTNKFVTIV
jgi:hypothetical protein